MKNIILLFTLFCTITSVLGDLKAILSRQPCEVNDDACFNDFIKTLYRMMLDGVEELNLKGLDPLHIDSIDGNLSIIKYYLTNSTLSGFNSCDIEKALILPTNETLKFDIMCKKLHLDGRYDVNGTLFVFPVTGNGTYWFNTTKYRIIIDTDISIDEGEDGRNYVTIKDFKFETDMQGTLDFSVDNLFGGNRLLSEPVLRFARRNWKRIAHQLQDPAIKEILTLLFNDFNTVLKNIPLDTIIKDA